MASWLDRVIASLHRQLDDETEAELGCSMAFPTRWDPFAERMTLAEVYYDATVHFDHHSKQLSPEGPSGRRARDRAPYSAPTSATSCARSCAGIGRAGP
jgi:hypothetical protein